MLLAFEIVFLFMLGLVTIVAIATVGRPLAIAYSEKLKARYKEIGSDEANNLKLRVSALEEEVRDLKKQITTLQESADFTIKLNASSQTQEQGKKNLH
ncbi:MAG TPA: hypothetical protein V6D17_10195 [Candidatus Obscuribacterales bacterium]